MCHSDGTVTLWDLSTQKMLLQTKTHNDEARAISFSSDGKYRATGGFDEIIAISECRSPEPTTTLKHDDKVVCVKWHPFLPILISTSADSTARVWTM